MWVIEFDEVVLKFYKDYYFYLIIFILDYKYLILWVDFWLSVF